MEKTRIILGARDPEMEAISAIARRFGAEAVQATAPGRDGEAAPVGPWNAYKATAPAPAAGDIWVECRPAGQSPAQLWEQGAMVADHHAPGDPGFGKSPEEAVAASSLGQVWYLLMHRATNEEQRAAGFVAAADAWGGDVGPSEVAYDLGTRPVWLSQELRIVAALDHCLGAACAGEVPGITREEALAAFLARPGMGTAEDFAAAEAALAAAPRVELGGASISDLRPLGCPEGRGRFDVGPLPGLRAVAMTTGAAYLSWVSTREGDASPRKLVLGGCGEGTEAGAAPVADFTGGWAEAEGLAGVYGDPVRGFAGAYPAT